MSEARAEAYRAVNNLVDLATSNEGFNTGYREGRRVGDGRAHLYRSRALKAEEALEEKQSELDQVHSDLKECQRLAFKRGKVLFQLGGMKLAEVLTELRETKAALKRSKEDVETERHLSSVWRTEALSQEERAKQAEAQLEAIRKAACE